MMIFKHVFLWGASLAVLMPLTSVSGGQTTDAAAPGTAAADAIADADVIAIRDWRYNDVYAGGWSARALLDDADVLGPTGDDIGEVENIIVDEEGRILSIIAEIGGFLDIGDTHVNIPWDEIKLGPDLENVTIPITEDTVARYSDFEASYLPADTAEGTITKVEEDDLTDDLVTGPRAWRVDELIGDYATLRDGLGYGYVRDIIFDTDGTISAVVVSAGARLGYGRYAYPHVGYQGGWAPWQTRYQLPYTTDEARELERFDYERLTTG